MRERKSEDGLMSTTALSNLLKIVHSIIKYYVFYKYKKWKIKILKKLSYNRILKLILNIVLK